MRKHPEITHEYTCESVRIRLKTNYETSILEVSSINWINALNVR